MSSYTNDMGLRARPSPFKGGPSATPTKLSGSGGSSSRFDTMSVSSLQLPQMTTSASSQVHPHPLITPMSPQKSILPRESPSRPTAESITGGGGKGAFFPSAATRGIEVVPEPNIHRISVLNGDAAGGGHANGTSTNASTTSSQSNTFSTFLQSSLYHSFEHELRTDGAVDLSRRSIGGAHLNGSGGGSGGVGGSEKQQRNKTRARHGLAGGHGHHAHHPSDPTLNGSRQDLMMMDEEEEEVPGDYAIIVKIERKVVSTEGEEERVEREWKRAFVRLHHAQHLAFLFLAHPQQLKRTHILHTLDTASNSLEASVVGVAGGGGRDPSGSMSGISGGDLTTSANGDVLLPPSSLTTLQHDPLYHHSPRLRTLCHRLLSCGLQFTRDRQLIHGCVLLKITASQDVLEAAAWRMKLKMPLKPGVTLSGVSGVGTAKETLAGASSSSQTEHPHATTTATSNPSTNSRVHLNDPALPTTSSHELKKQLRIGYTYLAFDPSIRELFLGTPDPTSLFRSSERQILIDFILRTSREDGGAGLGNQKKNELERKKRKERGREERRKSRAASSGISADRGNGDPKLKKTAVPGGSELHLHQPRATAVEEDSSSDEEDNSRNNTTDVSHQEEEIPHIAHHILSRYPLHSSRLIQLHPWISYWNYRSTLGTRAWLAGLFLQPLDAINSYFGNEVVFFYSFQSFYLRSLIIPSILGFILFVTQISRHSYSDTPLFPLFSLFFSLWSSIIIEIWKRKQSSYSWKWGSYEYEQEEEVERPEYEGVKSVDQVTGEESRSYPLSKRIMKLTISSLIWLLILIGFGTMMIHLFKNMDLYVDRLRQLSARTGVFSLDLLFVPCIWGVCIPILDQLFSLFAKTLTEWENWKYDSLFRTMLIVKIFSFRFINGFLALYYYMYQNLVHTSSSSSDGDATNTGSDIQLVRLTTSVASFMILGQIARFILSLGIPYLKMRWKNWRICEERLEEVRMRSNGGTNGVSSSSSNSSTSPLLTPLSSCWYESTLITHDSLEDYTNLSIQFGYICFFSVIFPFAPLCALIGNLIAIRLGAYKLCHLTRRPLSTKSSGLGIWLDVLQFVSIISVLTNCTLIGITTLQSETTWFPALSSETKILCIFIFEHILLSLKMLIHVAIPKQTREVEMQRRREKYVMKKANTELMELRRRQVLHHMRNATDASLYAVPT